jgi:acyl-CoA synthetase (AMP-forming)/AMP-acid ligase II
MYFVIDEFHHQIANSGANTLVTVPALLPVLLKVCDKVGLSRDRIFLFGDNQVDGCKPFYSLLPKDNNRRVSAPLKGINPAEDVAFICYSSGTTGVAKGVTLTHRNFVGQVLINVNFDPENTHDDDVLIAFLPFYHIYGLTLSLNSYYRVMPVVVMSRFELELFCQLIERYKVTFANIVPPIAVLLAKSPIVQKYDMSSIRTIGSGTVNLFKLRYVGKKTRRVFFLIDSLFFSCFLFRRCCSSWRRTY